MKKELTAELVREAFRYDAINGCLVRISSRWKSRYLGPVVGSRLAKGYLSVHFMGSPRLYHRLVWACVRGELPVGQIDHINGDKTDNRIENLRDVDGFTNQQNIRKARKHNSTGVLGVTPTSNGYRARITHNGKVEHLGSFKTIDLATEAYKSAKALFHCGAGQ